MSHARTPLPSQSHDQREIRLLADILALVLDDEQGQAEAALERIRQRAKQLPLTGGSLKNLFNILAETCQITDYESKDSAEPAAQTTEENSGTTKQIRNLEVCLENLSLEHRKLQSWFSALQHENELLRHNHAQTRFLKPLHRAAIAAALIAGLLIGIALAETFHAI